MIKGKSGFFLGYYAPNCPGSRVGLAGTRSEAAGLCLNHFLGDIYNDQKILQDQIIPREIVESADGFLQPCLGQQPLREFGATLPAPIWCGTGMVSGMSWRIICGFPQGFPIC